MEKSCVIGCGSISARHTEAIEELKDKTFLAAVCDIKPERTVKYTNKYGCAAYTDYAKMLDEVKPTVAHICTPHWLHYEMADECLRRGINVVLEKPPALNYAQAQALCEAAAKSSAKIGICFQNRYNKTSMVLKERVSSGEYGKLLGARAFVTWSRDDGYYTSSGWRGRKATEGGGVLINQSIHTLDLMQWVMGDVEKVRGHVSNYRFSHINDTEDTAELMIDFKNGARGIFFATVDYVTDSQVFLEVLTEKAEFTLCGSLTVKHSGGRTEVFENETVASGEKAYWGNAHTLLIADFYSKLHNPEPFWISPAEAAKNMKILSVVI